MSDMSKYIDLALFEEAMTTGNVGGLDVPMSSIPNDGMVRRKKKRMIESWSQNGIPLSDVESRLITTSDMDNTNFDNADELTGLILGTVIDFDIESSIGFAHSGAYRKFDRVGDTFRISHQWMIDNPEELAKALSDYNYNNPVDGVELCDIECEDIARYNTVKDGSEFYKRILNRLRKTQGENLDGRNLVIDGKSYKGYLVYSINDGDGICVYDKKANKLIMVCPQGTHVVNFSDSNGSKDRFIKSLR